MTQKQMIKKLNEAGYEISYSKYKVYVILTSKEYQESYLTLRAAYRDKFK